MENQAITIYVFCDEILKALKFNDDPQCLMTNAEVISFSILAAKNFAGNHKLARYYLNKVGLFPKILCNSRLNRRVRNIPWEIWISIFRFLSMLFKEECTEGTFAVDSFPVPFCQKSRIDRRKLFVSKEYLGFSASKKKYFCGIKVHMVVTTKGEPIECIFRPASENDVSVLWKMELDLPPFSKLFADGAYTCFELEDILQEDSCIQLLPKRGSMIKKRVRNPEEEREISSQRQIVETAFSSITRTLPRNFQVRTEKGFLLRIYSAVLAYSFSFLY